MSIVIRAGKRALTHIRKNGLSQDDIDLFIGASGGPKCLILNGLDRAIFGTWFKKRKKPLTMIGSSIGCYRISALAQKNPLEAITRFGERYAAQSYSQNPDAKEISDEAESILEDYVGSRAVQDILSHPFMRVHFIAARARGIGAFDLAPLMAPHFAAAYIGNLFSRTSLNLFFERYVFRDSRSALNMELFPDVATKAVDLNADNFHKAVLASGAIPFAMQGVNDIPGCPGTFRDGGIIDYHFDLPFDNMTEGLALYPHFFDKLVPGWLDKSNNRKPSAANYSNVVFVAPSQKFIETLPNAKVPDRKDVVNYLKDTAGRIAVWNSVIRAGREIGEEFMHTISTGGIGRKVKPIEELL